MSFHGKLLRAGACHAAAAGLAVGLLSTGHVLAQDVKPGAAPAGTSAGSVRTPVRPGWNDLTVRQQAALTPLAAHWASLSETQRQKWIALSRNYDRLSEGEQAKLQERMSDWAALSVQQRNQARLNFAETSKLPADEKKARWEAYQALSEEERGKLASTSKPTRPAGGAATIKPEAQPRLTRIAPVVDTQQPRPKIGVRASDLDHNTLLPQHPVVHPATPPAASR